MQFKSPNNHSLIEYLEYQPILKRKWFQNSFHSQIFRQNVCWMKKREAKGNERRLLQPTNRKRIGRQIDGERQQGILVDVSRRYRRDERARWCTCNYFQVLVPVSCPAMYFPVLVFTAPDVQQQYTVHFVQSSNAWNMVLHLVRSFNT